MLFRRKSAIYDEKIRFLRFVQAGILIFLTQFVFGTQNTLQNFLLIKLMYCLSILELCEVACW